jgi:hypothetical protein
VLRHSDWFKCRGIVACAADAASVPSTGSNASLPPANAVSTKKGRQKAGSGHSHPERLRSASCPCWLEGPTLRWQWACFLLQQDNKTINQWAPSYKLMFKTGPVETEVEPEVESLTQRSHVSSQDSQGSRLSNGKSLSRRGSPV